MVANYKKMLQGITQFSQVVRKFREKEVIFPPVLEFPFARAKGEALSTFTANPEMMSGVPQPGPPSLPFEEAERLYAVVTAEVPGEAPVELPEAPIAVEFRVTDHRLNLYGYTEGCPRCDTGDSSRGHSAACKARILPR